MIVGFVMFCSCSFDVISRFTYDAVARHLEEKTMQEIENRLKHDDLYRYADWKKVSSCVCETKTINR